MSGSDRTLREAGVTRREADVLAGIGERLTNPEIAARLGISVRTVESHVSALMAKLAAPDRQSLRSHCPATPSPRPATFPGSLRDLTERHFVGRADELRQLGRRWEDIADGRSRLVLIEGEAGIGKSRLAAEFAAQVHAAGAIVLHGRCDAELAIPYDGFAEALCGWLQALPHSDLPAQLGVLAADLGVLLPWLPNRFPGLPVPAPEAPETRRYRLFEAVRELLDIASRSAPVLLVLDDLQWAAAPTVAMVRHVLRAPGPGRRLLVLGTVRDSEPASAALAELARDVPLTRLALAGLSEAELDELSAVVPAADRDRIRSALVAQAGGNPFFAVELLRHLAEASTGSEGAEGVPAQVRDVVARRAAKLSPLGSRLLRAAAVIGSDIPLEVLAEVTGSSGEEFFDAVEEAVHARLLVELPTPAVADGTSGPVRCTFAHAIVRQTLLGQLSEVRRRHLHSRIAAALESVQAADLPRHATHIAHHLAAAGSHADPVRLRRFRTMAGDHAMASAAFEDAVAHYEAAAAHDESAPAEERAQLRMALGTAYRNAGRWDAALPAWRAAMTIAEAAGDRGLVARSCEAAGVNTAYSGRLEEGIALMDHGLSVLPPGSAERALLLATAGGVKTYFCRPGGDEQLAEACEIADALGEDALLAHCLFYTAVQHSGQWEDRAAVAAGVRSADIFRRLGAHWQLADALSWVYLFLVGLGRMDEARVVGDELRPLAPRVGAYPAVMRARRMDTVIRYFATGCVEELEAFAERDRTFCLAGGWEWVSTHSSAWLAKAAWSRGDFKAALAHAEEAQRLEVPNIFRGWAWASRFECHAYAGHRETALAMLAEAPLPKPGRPNPWGSWIVLLSLVDGLWVLDAPQAAGDLYQLVLDCIERTGAVCSEYRDGFLVQRAAGIAAAATRQWDAADAHFRSALEQAHALPHRPEEAHTQRFWGQMLRTRGRPADRTAADELLRTAAANYRSMDMGWLADLTERPRLGNAPLP